MTEKEPGVYVVYPCSHKLDLTNDELPVAIFIYPVHAEGFKGKYWPTTGEVKRESLSKGLIDKFKASFKESR